MKTAMLATALVVAFATPTLADPQPYSPPPPVQTPPPQTPPLAAATPVAPAVPEACCKVAEGTVIDLQIIDKLNSRDKKTGDMFAIRLADPVVVGDAVLIPAGVTGMGQIIDVDPAGLMGKPAKMVLAARYLDSNGVRIPIRTFRLGGNGQDRGNLVMAADIAVGIVAVLIPGGNVEYPAGTRATAKIAKDMILPPMKAPEPVPVATPVPASPVAPSEKRTTQ